MRDNFTRTTLEYNAWMQVHEVITPWVRIGESGSTLDIVSGNKAEARRKVRKTMGLERSSWFNGDFAVKMAMALHPIQRLIKTPV